MKTYPCSAEGEGDDEPYALPKEEDKDDGAANGSSDPAYAPAKETEKEAPKGTDPLKN
jgi:hypothetical protein